MDAYNALLARASGVASTPYTPYTGELVAGVNQQQYSGINNINQNAGFAAPYIQQAATYANNAAQPLSAAQIQNYQNPYTQSVVNATENQFNLQNQQALNNIQGNAAMSGALGGDRAGVAKAAYYGAVQPGQNATIAGLYNQGYQSAVQTAEQQQQNQANAAYSLGNLGVAGQNAALTGANAQIGAGSLEQGTQQALDAALLQQFQTQQAFPYQQTQWLAGLDTGVGSQMGGTSSTTAPAPNPLNAILGAAAAGFGAYMGAKPARLGGGIPGLAVGGTPYGNVGWIPGVQIAPGRGAPPPPKSYEDPGFKMPQGLGGFGGHHGSNTGISTDPTGSGLPLEGSPDANSLNYVVPMANEGFGIGGVRTGGGIPGFADGGSPSFNDMWAADQGLGSPYPVSTAVPLPIARPDFDVDNPDSAYNRGLLPRQTVGSAGGDINASDIVLNAGPGGAGLGAPYYTDNAAQRADARIGEPTAYSDASYPSRRPNPLSSQDPEALGAYRSPAGAPLVYGPGYDRSGLGTNPAPSGAAPAGGISGFLANLPGRGSLSPAASQALMAAGLGMMASRSPFLGQAIGEGGLQGLGAYNQQVQQEFSREMQQEQKALDERKVNLAADKLAQEAQQFQQGLKLKTQQFEREGAQPRVIGTDEWGRNIYGALNPKTGNYEPIQLPPGAAPSSPGPGAAAAPAGAPSVPAATDPVARATMPAANAAPPTPQGPAGMAQAIAEYRLPPLTGYALRTPQGQMIMAKAQELNPSYNAQFYNEANQTRLAFGPKQLGNSVRSFGVGISHLDVLDQAADALQNRDTRKLNALEQYFQTELGTSTAPTSFDAIKPIVAAEVTKAIGGSNMALTDRQEIQAGLSRDLATMNIKDVIAKYKTLMGGQLVGLQRQYVNGIHSPNAEQEFEQKLSPAAVEMLHHGQQVEQNRGASAGRTPTDADRAYAKAHPEVHDKFVTTFGVEP